MYWFKIVSDNGNGSYQAKAPWSNDPYGIVPTVNEAPQYAPDDLVPGVFPVNSQTPLLLGWKGTVNFTAGVSLADEWFIQNGANKSFYCASFTDPVGTIDPGYTTGIVTTPILVGPIVRTNVKTTYIWSFNKNIVDTSPAVTNATASIVPTRIQIVPTNQMPLFIQTATAADHVFFGFNNTTLFVAEADNINNTLWSLSINLNTIHPGVTVGLILVHVIGQKIYIFSTLSSSGLVTGVMDIFTIGQVSSTPTSSVPLFSQSGTNLTVAIFDAIVSGTVIGITYTATTIDNGTGVNSVNSGYTGNILSALFYSTGGIGGSGFFSDRQGDPVHIGNLFSGTRFMGFIGFDGSTDAVTFSNTISSTIFTNLYNGANFYGGMGTMLYQYVDNNWFNGATPDHLLDGIFSAAHNTPNPPSIVWCYNMNVLTALPSSTFTGFKATPTGFLLAWRAPDGNSIGSSQDSFTMANETYDLALYNQGGSVVWHNSTINSINNFNFQLVRLLDNNFPLADLATNWSFFVRGTLAFCQRFFDTGSGQYGAFANEYGNNSAGNPSPFSPISANAFVQASNFSNSYQILCASDTTVLLLNTVVTALNPAKACRFELALWNTVSNQQIGSSVVIGTEANNLVITGVNTIIGSCISEDQVFFVYTIGATKMMFAFDQATFTQQWSLDVTSRVSGTTDSLVLQNGFIYLNTGFRIK